MATLMAPGLRHLRAEQPGPRHEFPHQLYYRHDQLARLAVAEYRLLQAGIPLHGHRVGQQTGWEEYQFFAFFSTGLIINALVQCSA